MQTTEAELKELIAENEQLRETIRCKDQEIVWLMEDISEMRRSDTHDTPWKPLPPIQPIETQLANLSNLSVQLANPNADVVAAFPGGRWT